MRSTGLGVNAQILARGAELREMPGEILDALLHRRSVRPRRLQPPGPSALELQRIVAAGLHGIDHGRLRPWRLLLVEDRSALAEAFALAERELRPEASPEKIAAARDKAMEGPLLLALIADVCADIDANVPIHEQWIAVGAAAQQMLLACEALGYAGSLLSGRKTRTLALRSAFGLASEQHLAGFLTFGTVAAEPAKRPEEDAKAFLTPWP